jgi:DNA-binding GntR family transcriptional regulator
MTQQRIDAVARAYRAIHDMTVNFEIAPDARLNEVDLANRLGMSRAPVREALNRLVADGLVTFAPGRGFRCRRLSAKEIGDLYGVRRDLEVAAVREAAAGHDRDQGGALLERWTAVLRDEATTDVDALIAADEAFHADLVGLSGNLERVRILHNINARIRFVRRINLDDDARRHASLAEHLPILTAVLEGQDETAARQLADHLAISSDEVRRHVEAGLARIFADAVA